MFEDTPMVNTRHLHLDGIVPLLASYGFASEFFETLRAKNVMKYPPRESIDFLYDAIHQCFKSVGALSGQPTEVFLVTNANMHRTVSSSNTRKILPRRTPIYAFGPNLQLYPSQWQLRRIWRSGGLVTFSPTFVLRSPEKFSEIMRLIRTSKGWAAYLLPSVLEWAQSSWAEPAWVSSLWGGVG